MDVGAPCYAVLKVLPFIYDLPPEWNRFSSVQQSRSTPLEGLIVVKQPFSPIAVRDTTPVTMVGLHRDLGQPGGPKQVQGAGPTLITPNVPRNDIVVVGTPAAAPH